MADTNEREAVVTLFGQSVAGDGPVASYLLLSKKGGIPPLQTIGMWVLFLALEIGRFFRKCGLRV